MTQLYRRNGSPFYYAKFQHAGVVHRCSTGEKTRKAALAVLAERVASVKEERKASEILDQLLAAVERLPATEQDRFRHEAVRRLQRTQSAQIPVGKAWEVWRGSPRGKMPGETTVAGYAAIWKRFEKWLSLEHPEVRTLHEVSHQIAEDYAANMDQAGVSPRTFNAHIGFLRSLFKALSRRAGLTENPWAEIPSRDLETKGRRDLSEAELRNVLEKAEGELRPMVLLGIYTGMRLGDVCSLRWDALSSDLSVLQYLPRKTRRKGKVVRIPVHTELAKVLKHMRKSQEGEQVFPEFAKLYDTDRSAVSKRFQELFRAAGIATNPNGKRDRGLRSATEVGYHSLRHSFVSMCAQQGAPQVALMELVGHGSPAMTRVYSHAGDEIKQSAIGKLPKIGSRPPKKSGE